MDMKLIDLIFTITTLLIGGILKHVYGKFADLDNTDKEHREEIHRVSNNISVLMSQRETDKSELIELKADIKDIKRDMQKILISLNK
jgi:hypothetical protein